VRGAHSKSGARRSRLAVLLVPVDRIAAWGDGGPLRAAAVSATSIALVVALALGGIGAWDWLHVRGWPVEHARVVKAVDTGRTERCGRSSSEEIYELTWVSENPPPGLPKEFTNEEGCTASSLGDRVDVVRVIESDGGVHVWDEPATSVAQVGLMGLGGLVFGWVFGVALSLVALAWHAAVHRIRRMRRR